MRRLDGKQVVPFEHESAAEMRSRYTHCLVDVGTGEDIVCVITNDDEPVDLELDKDDGGAVANAYGVRSIPSMFIVGPDGKVAYSTVGFDPRAMPQIKSTIDGLLAQVEGGKGKGASADHGTADRATAERME